MEEAHASEELARLEAYANSSRLGSRPLGQFLALGKFIKSGMLDETQMNLSNITDSMMALIVGIKTTISNAGGADAAAALELLGLVNQGPWPRA